MAREGAHATPAAPPRYGEAYPAWDEAHSLQTTERTTLVATSVVDIASSTDVATVATANDANLAVYIFSYKRRKPLQPEKKTRASGNHTAHLPDTHAPSACIVA